MSFSTLNTFNSINKNNKLPLLQSDTTTLYTNYIPTLTQNGDNNITNPDINKSGIYNVSASSEYGGQPYYSAFGAFSNVKRYWAGQITNPYNSSGVYTGPIATSYINEFGSGVSVYGEYVQIKLPQKFKITNFTTATCFSPPRELLIIGSIDTFVRLHLLIIISFKFTKFENDSILFFINL